MTNSAGLLTQIPPSCDAEVYVSRIQWHARRILKPGASVNERLIRLRSIIAAANDAYEKELQQFDSLNFAVVDPQVTSVAGVVVE